MTRADLDLLLDARLLARTGEAATIREAAGLSQAEVGQVCGASHATISRWERGERTPHGRPAIEWARLLRELRDRATASAVGVA